MENLPRLARRKCREEQEQNHQAEDEQLPAPRVHIERRKIRLPEQAEQIVNQVQQHRRKYRPRGVHRSCQQEAEPQVNREQPE